MADLTTAQQKKKIQTRRYTEAEFMTMKHSFAENNDFFKAIRKHMMQFELTTTEIDIIKGVLLGKTDVFAVLSKAFLPQLDTDAPFSQMIDLWMTFELKDKQVDIAMINILSRDLLIRYLQQQIDLLNDIVVSKVSETPAILFSSLSNVGEKEAEVAYYELQTRNTIISHTEQQCAELLLLSGLTEETPQQTLDRLDKDSSK